MQALIFIAGFLLCGLGAFAYRSSGDPILLQGGLTLGGGWIICGLFSLRAKWHGIVGAGLLGFLGGIRSVPSLISLGGDPAAPFNVATGALCLIVLIAAIRTLVIERRRLSIEALKAGDDEAPAP